MGSPPAGSGSPGGNATPGGAIAAGGSNAAGGSSCGTSAGGVTGSAVFGICREDVSSGEIAQMLVMVDGKHTSVSNPVSMTLAG